MFENIERQRDKQRYINKAIRKKQKQKQDKTNKKPGENWFLLKHVVD